MKSGKLFILGENFVFHRRPGNVIKVMPRGKVKRSQVIFQDLYPVTYVEKRVGKKDVRLLALKQLCTENLLLSLYCCCCAFCTSLLCSCCFCRFQEYYNLHLCFYYFLNMYINTVTGIMITLFLLFLVIIVITIIRIIILLIINIYYYHH